ncbi:MAG: hypothetical protein NUV44_03115 [Candidatus Scalindua sp.]|nr:hypothetical protein [Candidatus Scalindua sp.]
MKYQFVPAPVPARKYAASPCAGTDGGWRTPACHLSGRDSSDKSGVLSTGVVNKAAIQIKTY